MNPQTPCPPKGHVTCAIHIEERKLIFSVAAQIGSVRVSNTTEWSTRPSMLSSRLEETIPVGQSVKVTLGQQLLPRFEAFERVGVAVEWSDRLSTNVLHKPLERSVEAGVRWTF